MDLTPDRFVVDAAVVARAITLVDPGLLAAFHLTKRHLQVFCEHQRMQDWTAEVSPGVHVGERFLPVAAAGLYVPFGKALYPSSALMITVPPAVAGVRRIVMASSVDPATGEIPAEVLAAGAIGGATEFWRLSGTAAVAAFAYGTETLDPVDVIAGPGGPYVAAAKRAVSDHVAIDLEAGPSETIVLALAGDPGWIAADLIAETEHGMDSSGLVITADRALAAAVAAEVSAQVPALPQHRRDAVAHQIAVGATAVVLVPDDSAAIDLVNRFAPEHCVVHAEDAATVAKDIVRAGTVCIGPFTSSAMASYVAGTNHVLPTGGSARYGSGLSIDRFVRRQSISRIDADALAGLRPAVAAYADFEGFPGHLAAVDRRLADDISRGDAIANVQPDTRMA